MSLGPTGRGWLATATLAALGAVAGAVTGLVVTAISHLLWGLPPTWGSPFFLSNAISMGSLGVILGPAVSWLLLRRVPLWRAVGEPALVGLAAMAVTLAFGSLSMSLVAFATLAAAWRLNRSAQRLPAPSTEPLPLAANDPHLPR
jgi:hypothetical protein